VWAALAALADASRACDGVGIGFMNPALYRAASSDYASLFHDVTVGNNDLTGTHHGLWPAHAGYDLATGLGSPDAAALATALCADSLRLRDPGSLVSVVHSAVDVALAARDAPGASVNYRATGLPAGLRLDPASGAVTGRPQRAGTSTVHVLVADGAADVQSEQFTWAIAAAPKLRGVSLRSVGSGQPQLRFTVRAARGGPAIVQLKVALPAGLRSASRLRSVTVTEAGGQRARFRGSGHGSKLTITLGPPSPSVAVELRYAGIRASGWLVSRVGAGGHPLLRLSVTPRDATGAEAPVIARVRPAS
jgi:hypothetical protein